MPKEKKPRKSNRSNEIKYQKMLQSPQSERQTTLQLFRQIIIESVAVCYPYYIDTNSILLISKLKYPEQIEMEDMHELLYQLKTEGMFLQSPDEPCLKSFRFCFNDMHESLLRFPLNKTGHIYKYKDKILKKMLNEETEAERLIRLMRKRAQRVYFDKLVQFDIDVKNLYQALPENKWVSFSEIMNLLPEAWKIWRARNTPWYVMRAVHLLQLKRFIKRCPEREMFIKLEKDIGY